MASARTHIYVELYPVHMYRIVPYLHGLSALCARGATVNRHASACAHRTVASCCITEFGCVSAGACTLLIGVRVVGCQRRQSGEGGHWGHVREGDEAREES